MDFVAIDFETANAQRASACSLGITVVKNNKVVEEKYWLIKPYPFKFDPRNIFIHGIREEDVINEKEFDEIWCEIKPYLENNLVIAHNSSFDFSVLRKTLDLYEIEYPNLDYACTL
ncbi:MAG: 3'-5' exonuclease, partial [Peptostreptococcaceae bacterium]